MMVDSRSSLADIEKFLVELDEKDLHENPGR
jgi:hypothetical protein